MKSATKIATKPKKIRLRAAKAELLMDLYIMASEWADLLSGERDDADWDPTSWDEACARYRLSREELAKVAQIIADDLCNRSIRLGWDDLDSEFPQ